MQVYIVYNIQDYKTTFVRSCQAFGSKKNSF
jgi:hypothetical protein